MNKASLQTTRFYHLKGKQTNFIYLNKNFINLKFQCALKKGINHGTHRNTHYETNITKYVNTSFLIMLKKLWVHIYYN